MSESSTVPRPPEQPVPPPHHKRLLWIASIAAATALILVSAAVFFAPRGPAPTVVGAGPTTSPTTSTTPGGPAPDGRIFASELRSATLDIPPWPIDNLSCLSGRMTFVNGEVTSPVNETYYFERHIVIFTAAYGEGEPAFGDVDGDGAQETVVLIGCVVQGGGGQLVALDRDAAGQIVTIGTVVALTGDVKNIDTDTVRVLPNGTVEADVGDYQNCCGGNTPVQWQTRGYAWNGHQFNQVSGPGTFPVNPGITDTAMTAGDLVFGPGVNGMRHGTLTVTVSYLRGGRPDHLSIFFFLSTDIEPDGSAWPPVRTARGMVVVDLPTPDQYRPATYTFEFRRPANASNSTFEVYLRAMSALDTGDPLAGHWLTEWNPDDNRPAISLLQTD